MASNNAEDIAEKATGAKLQQAPSAASYRLGDHKPVEDSAVREFYGSAVNESYRLKSELVARHLSEIGTGRFQWILFVVNGCGWMVDNFWSQGITAVRPPIMNEFDDITRLSFSSVAYYVGLIVGAFFWGTAADVIGRKPAFNSTIFIGAIFACAVAGSQDFITFCSLWAVIGTAAGAPKYLLSKGRDAEAVESVNYIARYNGKPETLTLEMMQDIDRQIYSSAVVSSTGEPVHAIPDQTEKKLSMKDILKENFKDFNMSSYRSLFAGRKMAQHSAVTFLIWLTIGIAYPLYFAFITSYLESKKDYTASSSFNHTYMIYCIVSAVGVLGPISAGFLVETRFGRRWMMAISAVLTGVFLFAYTAVGTEAADIGFQCATAILGNFEYAVMFAFTPESFPGPVRGTGTGIAATLLRLGGLVASFISTYSGFTVVPIYASAALWIVVGFFCLGLPYETHGHASL
ncbi:related to synaptic vesicle transporter SV2 (major facilitator superfamily) [Fusarium fujikuroi IMI 58289]|uniref:Related to synaptic vesicle transporter SV2 (Major facilitator superfamily) n=1 Tax=Gibberella fujikuroi (strain CBS 195.34 / IMI 58289 / NRRL A-6831) TaxID=1279085 RepID=S0EEP2_GIBF5|nr:related to synaptic vesicle transporter SV2 (major facilitator superfamily) [Fusarium fujikuroi IMI 58289]CCT73135.1 related to synaptic vesicle transporter SV2 (major facilitator superfamily) [Fusarium fujikuroi IMI 58289]